MKFISTSLLILLSITFGIGQTCNIGFEDFTDASSANPPTDWIRGNGTNIGNSFPANPATDPAVGFNNVGEYMISNALTCAGQVCFDWHASSINSVHQAEISIAQTDSFNTTWIPLDTIMTPGSGNTPNTYQNVCYPIPTDSLVAPFNIRVKWQMIQRTSGTFYFENVCFDAGTCSVTPTQLIFSDLPNACKQKNIDFNVLLCATDNNGYIDSTYTDNISLNLVSGPGAMNGAISGSAINGCFNAVFSIDASGMYSIRTSSSSNMLKSDTISFEVVDLCPNVDTLKIMSYNLLNYPNGRDDCGSNTVVPSRWDTLANITEYVKPDVLMVCELQDMTGSDSILTQALNIGGISNYAKATFVANQSTASVLFNNMFFYNSDKMTLYDQSEILTTTRDFNKYTVYLNDPQLAVHEDTVFIDFYMAHLKAGSAATDVTRRGVDCQILRDYLDARPDRNNVLGGDLNFYTDQEAAYQTLITGLQPFDDPADMEGAWDGNFAFAEVFTQSSREPGAPNYDCGFGGGNDSRFDFLMTSTSIRDSTNHVSVVPDSYTPVGNNGSIFNKAVNDPANSSGVPIDVLNSLYFMSDHLPVVMKLQVTYPSSVDSCILVYNNADSGVGSLRAAIDCAKDGDIINFSEDLLGQTITLSTDSILINKDIRIVSASGLNITVSSITPQVTTVPTVFHIAAGKVVIFDGFTIAGAFGPDGSAIINSGDLLLTNMTVTNGGKTDINSIISIDIGAILRVRGTVSTD